MKPKKINKTFPTKKAAEVHGYEFTEIDGLECGTSWWVIATLPERENCFIHSSLAMALHFAGEHYVNYYGAS